MKINEAINKAIKGGWEKLPYEIGGNNKVIDNENIVGAILVPLKNDSWLSLQKTEILLDPIFWQALGKAMGWRKTMYIDEASKQTQKGDWITTYYKETPEWLYHWHRLIDHLAEGKSIESFFEEIK